MKPVPNREQVEWMALRFLMNGQGTHRVPDSEWTQQAIVGFPLHQPERPVVFFRQDGRTVATVEFRVVPVPPSEQTDFGISGDDDEGAR
jgi:hypothetical protein